MTPPPSAELHAGILAASIPTLRPLFRSLLESTSRHIRSYGYQAYGGDGGRSYAKDTTTTHGASSLPSSSRRHRRRLHRHHAPALGSAHYYRNYGHGDEAHTIGLVSMAHGSKWDRAVPVIAGGHDTAAAEALGYNARVTATTAAAMTTTVVRAAKGGGASDDGNDDNSEDGILMPAPPRMAITKRTEVVVMR